MDDQLLLGASQARVDRRMAQFRRLGVDRLRVSAFWDQLGPAAKSRTKPPGFNGANSLDSRYGWVPLDRVIGSAARNGLKVMVSISTPAPLWATFRGRGLNSLWKPSPSEFADFTEAVVSRYAVFVDHWAISNEPNQGGWLQPQSTRRAGLVAPHHYRAMVQAAYPRIKALDPTSTALIGELASSGRAGRGRRVPIRPLTFLRTMACRDGRYRRMRRGPCRNFTPVPADAIGHHPYQFFQAPSRPSRNRNDAGIGDTRRLLRVLDKLVRLGAIKPPTRRRLNVHYTEFGYQTKPPDPFAGVPLSTQRRYIQDAAYIAWRAPRVREINQFRLTDGRIKGRGPASFREFQSGLMFANGKPKPAYSVFAHPLVISGSRFWGQARPGGRHVIRVQFRRSRRARFQTVAQVLSDTRGYFSFRLPGRRPGHYRFKYSDGDVSGTSRVSLVRR